MSHITKIDVEITDREALIEAAVSIGLEYREKNHYRYYFEDSEQNKCEFALGVPGSDRAYEIGVIRKGDKYILGFDTHANGHGLINLTANVVNGKSFGPVSKLVQQYARNVAVRQLRSKGYRVQETTNEKGELVLVAV